MVTRNAVISLVSMLLPIFVFAMNSRMTNNFNMPRSCQDISVSNLNEQCAAPMAALSLMCILAAPASSSARGLSYATDGQPTLVADSLLEDKLYKKTLFNIPPAEPIYPDVFLGTWMAQYTYDSAVFTDKVMFQDLQRDPNVAGYVTDHIITYTIPCDITVQSSARIIIL